MSQENLSVADQEFEGRERERALKSLTRDLTLWESLGASRDKVYDLPPSSSPSNNRHRHYPLYQPAPLLVRLTQPPLAPGPRPTLTPPPHTPNPTPSRVAAHSDFSLSLRP